MLQAFTVIDFLTVSFVIGATLWFFFIQSPTLLKKLGREKFVPIQMKLTLTLFKALTIALFLMLLASSVREPIGSPSWMGVCIAFIAVLGNQFVIVPKALKAGGQSIKTINGKDAAGSTRGFATEGVGSKTKALHRTVVLFVVMMLAGVIFHGLKQLAP